MTRKQIRKSLSTAGWIMLLYYLLINGCVLVATFVEMTVTMIRELQKGNWEAILNGAMERAATGAWGYFLAAGVGLAILFAWKKPVFWREQIWAKGKPMTPGAFFGLLSIFLSGQFLYQFLVIVFELLLNSLGLTMVEGLESLSAGSGGFGMFLYIGILAPITEELLCRGLVQRTLMPYGKKFAIFCSAFLFGILHGNVLQAPYAFAVGLVLGYVAAEYSIAWAMVLHMINNLVLGDMLTRLTAGLSEMAYVLILWGILTAFAIGAVITLVRRRRNVAAWLRSSRMEPVFVQCFFSSAGVITFMVLMVLSMIGTCFMLISPM